MPVDNQIYDRLAETWWRPGSALGGLDTLNPGRFAYLDHVLGARGLRYDDLKVLDLGCGGGLMSEAYARRGAQVAGVDPSSASLKVARSHAHESGLSIRYEQGRSEAIPFADASFDLVSCCDVLEHVDDLDASSREIARVLRRGGLFFFDTINRTWLSWLFVIEVFQEWLHVVPPGTHDWDMFITPAELRGSLAQSGLELCDFTGLGPRLDPLGLGRALLHRATGRMDHRDALALVGPSTFASLLYMGWATTQTGGPRRRPRAKDPTPADTGRRGEDPMTVKPHDDSMHENTGEPNFNESMYFNFYDRSAKLGGFARIGNRANEGYAEVTLTVYLPDGTAMFNYMRPPIADNSAFNAGGMRFDVIEPFKHLRVTYDGSAVFLAQPLQLENPKRAFTSNPHQPVQLALDYYGLSPMYGGEAPLQSPDMVFAKGHTEQHVKATGTITVNGHATALNALGLRDHSWGPRSWQSPKFYRWLTCEFDEHFGFMGSQIVMQNGTEILSGFVFKDGENLWVNTLELHTERVGEGQYHDRITTRLRTPAGDFDISGKVLAMLPLRNRRDGKTTRIAEGLTEWRCGDHVGYGLSEYLDQIE